MNVLKRDVSPDCIGIRQSLRNTLRVSLLRKVSQKEEDFSCFALRFSDRSADRYFVRRYLPLKETDRGTVEAAEQETGGL